MTGNKAKSSLHQTELALVTPLRAAGMLGVSLNSVMKMLEYGELVRQQELVTLDSIEALCLKRAQAFEEAAQARSSQPLRPTSSSHTPPAPSDNSSNALLLDKLKEVQQAHQQDVQRMNQLQERLRHLEEQLHPLKPPPTSRTAWGRWWRH